MRTERKDSPINLAKVAIKATTKKKTETMPALCKEQKDMKSCATAVERKDI